MTSQEEWLLAHTFFCVGLKARITPEQCRINKESTGRGELWACKKCKEYKLVQKETLPMSISQNVKDETVAALRSSQNQSQAAAKLGITQSALYWRIMKDKEIHAVADELGFLRKKAHATGLPGPKAAGKGAMQKRTSIKGQFDKKADLAKLGISSNEKAKSDTVVDVNQNALSGESVNQTEPENKELKNSLIPAAAGISVDPLSRAVEVRITIHCGLEKLPEIIDALQYLG